MMTSAAKTLLALLLVGAVRAAEPAPANYDESKVGSLPLPDPLVCLDGTPVRDVATWQSKRRPELLELFAREVYGRTPAGRPAEMHWKVASVDRGALGGKATRKQVTIWFTSGETGPKLDLLIYQPNGLPSVSSAIAPGATAEGSAKEGRSAPWPVFLGLNYFGNTCVNADPGIQFNDGWMRDGVPYTTNHRATEATRGANASRWEIEMVIARGYATATAYYGDLCPDWDQGMEESVGKMFHSGTRNDRPADGWGSIGIWAWGLSRAMDYILTDPELDGRKVAVHGLSRLGKTALWAGAQDERFALVISCESGAGGAALAKRIYGETVAISNSRHSTPWYALNYRKYNDNEAALPIDQHELLALIAPRPLYVSSAIDDLLADPRGEFLSAKYAGAVYGLFGKDGVGVEDFPSVNHPVGGTIGYHVRAGGHDQTAYDWKQYLGFADRHFGKR